VQATPVKNSNPNGIRIATPTMAILVAQRARPGEAKQCGRGCIPVMQRPVCLRSTHALTG
jgi:hypothetical protein